MDLLYVVLTLLTLCLTFGAGMIVESYRAKLIMIGELLKLQRT